MTSLPDSLAFAKSYAGKQVCVTGADGFIGSHLVEALVAGGAKVRALSYYTSFGRAGWLTNSPVADQVEILPGDIRDNMRVAQAVKGCDTVFHLAALIGIPYSYVAPESYVQVNVQGSFNVALACRDAGVSRLVHTSTSETYGTAQYVPIDENHPMQPQSPYSASKIGGDMMVLSLRNAYELPVVVARPFNTYGPRQSTRAVLPTIATQLLRGASQIKLGALDPTRDFNYVSDTVNGFLALGATPGIEGETINIGSGTEITVGDAAKLLMEIVGNEALIVTDQQRIRPADSEVERLLSDNAKIVKLTGWQPQVSLRDGFTAMVEWIRDNLDEIDNAGYAI
jgi:NAD dependent epimerase/dehydratase